MEIKLPPPPTPNIYIYIYIYILTFDNELNWKLHGELHGSCRSKNISLCTTQCAVLPPSLLCWKFSEIRFPGGSLQDIAVEIVRGRRPTTRLLISVGLQCKLIFVTIVHSKCAGQKSRDRIPFTTLLICSPHLLMQVEIRAYCQGLLHSWSGYRQNGIQLIHIFLQ